MEDVKPEGWRQLLQPCDSAGRNSVSLLRRSSSWRRPGERGYYEGPVAQVNEPPHRARPQSCIEGGRVDKWLQTLERLQSRRMQKKTPSMPTLPNEMRGSNPLCPDLSSLRSGNQTPSVCGSFRSSLESVHIKAAPSAERAQVCALAPVRFGWLPIQRHVILTDVSNSRHHNNSCQQKLKSPITPVLLSSPAKFNGPKANDREPVRPEAASFRYWRTPEKNSSTLQASGSVSSEGGRNGPPAWNPKAKVDTSQSQHAKPHPGRRGSAPESFSSSISSITITSRKITHTSGLPTSEIINEPRKALVVKVTEQRTKTTVVPTSACNHEENHHGVIMRRKATIVKMTQQTEHFTHRKPNPTQCRHSYTEGLKNTQNEINPSPLTLHPAGNQWRSSVCLHLDNNSRTTDQTRAFRPVGRPVSCDASWFSRSELNANAVTDLKSPPVPQKTNIDAFGSSSSEAGSRTGSSAPLRLLKASESCPHLSADAVLALNAAAVIANIKAQRRSAASFSEDGGGSEHVKLKDAEREKKTPPAAPCADFIPFESQNVPRETVVALSLSEALAIRRPDFIQRSQARVRALEWRSQERQRTENTPVPEHRESLLKSKGRSIMGKALQLRSRRNYNQLPEVKKRKEEEKKKKEEEKRKLTSRTNRLRAELFKKKLLEQILQRGGNH